MPPGQDVMKMHNGQAQPDNRREDKKTKQVKVTVDAGLAQAFNKACAGAGVSMAAAVAKFMAEFTATAAKKKPLPDYSAKRQRRAAIKKIMIMLEQIMDSESEYMEKIPENLRGSFHFDNAEQFVSSLEEALEILGSI